MRALLKSYNLPDNAIKIYTEYVGKGPFTFNEIKKFMSKQSEEEIRQILDDLINKKLLLHVKPPYSFLNVAGEGSRSAAAPKLQHKRRRVRQH